jgi:hypothetical protein
MPWISGVVVRTDDFDDLVVGFVVGGCHGFVAFCLGFAPARSERMSLFPSRDYAFSFFYKSDVDLQPEAGHVGLGRNVFN